MRLSDVLKSVLRYPGYTQKLNPLGVPVGIQRLLNADDLYNLQVADTGLGEALETVSLNLLNLQSAVTSLTGAVSSLDDRVTALENATPPSQEQIGQIHYGYFTGDYSVGGTGGTVDTRTIIMPAEGQYFAVFALTAKFGWSNGAVSQNLKVQVSFNDGTFTRTLDCGGSLMPSSQVGTVTTWPVLMRNSPVSQWYGGTNITMTITWATPTPITAFYSIPSSPFYPRGYLVYLFNKNLLDIQQLA